jgi:hypothetical protein
LGGHRGWRAGDGTATGGAPTLEGRLGPPAEYRGPKGVLPGRLRRGRTHRLDAEMVRGVWRLSAAARDGVLVGEGVSGGTGEVPELRGGKGEVRVASIGEGRARRGCSLKRDGRRHSNTNPRRGGRLWCPRGVWASSTNEEGAVWLYSDKGAEKWNQGRRRLLKTNGHTR